MRSLSVYFPQALYINISLSLSCYKRSCYSEISDTSHQTDTPTANRLFSYHSSRAKPSVVSLPCIYIYIHVYTHTLDVFRSPPFHQQEHSEASRAGCCFSLSRPRGGSLVLITARAPWRLLLLLAAGRTQLRARARGKRENEEKPCLEMNFQKRDRERMRTKWLGEREEPPIRRRRFTGEN